MIIYTYNWPGNVRELRNLVERLTILSSNESKQKINQVIDDILMSSSQISNNNKMLEQSFQSPLKEAREHFEKEYLTTQLKKHHGNISKTADFIGMERSALHRKLKSLELKELIRMNIIICGAGKVGFSISKQLSAQGHSVTIIDQSSDDIKKINDTQDVKGIVGRATLPTVLENAGAEKADMIIAVTRNDETNMIVCQLASSLFNVSKKLHE